MIDKTKGIFVGCGNHMCSINPPKGQGTNGPCGCPRSKLWAYIAALEGELAELKDVHGNTVYDNTELQATLNKIERWWNEMPQRGNND